MAAEIIDGNRIAAQIRQGLAGKIKELKEKHGLTPGLPGLCAYEKQGLS